MQEYLLWVNLLLCQFLGNLMEEKIISEIGFGFETCLHHLSDHICDLEKVLTFFMPQLLICKIRIIKIPVLADTKIN